MLDFCGRWDSLVDSCIVGFDDQAEVGGGDVVILLTLRNHHRRKGRECEHSELHDEV